MPTFGNTNAEVNEQSPVRIVYGRHNLSESGDIQSITVYIHTNSSTESIQCALYDDDGGAPQNPSNLLGTTEIRSLNIASGSVDWYTFNFASPISATSGDYWLALYNTSETSNTLRWYVGSAGTGDTHYTAASPGGWPDPATVAIQQTGILSIYATYTVGGAPTLALLGVGQ